MINKANAWLTGFRTVLLQLIGWGLLYVDVFVSGLTGLSSEALKGAAVMALLTTVKQIKTDVIPSLRARLEKKS